MKILIDKRCWAIRHCFKQLSRSRLSRGYFLCDTQLVSITSSQGFMPGTCYWIKLPSPRPSPPTLYPSIPNLPLHYIRNLCVTIYNRIETFLSHIPNRIQIRGCLIFEPNSRKGTNILARPPVHDSSSLYKCIITCSNKSAKPLWFSRDSVHTWQISNSSLKSRRRYISIVILDISN